MPKPTPPPPLRPALRTWAVATVLLAGTVLLFSRLLGYGFINYDDPRYILENPHVQSGFTWDSIAWAFTGNADYWHPLTWLSHMLDWQLYGSAAAGHHLTSILWHAANAVLAFWVLRRLTGAYWTSALAAALFAWHPLRVESVAWVTERKDVMSGTFFLLTLWAYAIYADRRRTGRRAWPAYLGVIGWFLGGLMAKPSLVTLPAVLCALDFWPLRRCESESWRRLLIEKIPLGLLSVVIAIITVLMQRQVGAFMLDLPLAARAGNAAVSVARYLGKFFWPFDLSIIYPHPGWWPAGLVIGALLAIAALTGLAWWQRSRRPWLLTGWIWFLAVLLPASGLVQVGPQAMADRYTYLSLLGIELSLLWTLRELAVGARRRAALIVLGGVALAGSALRTWDQEGNWRDAVTLYRHALAVTPRNDMAHKYLSYSLLALNQLDEAMSEARLALAITPNNGIAHYVLGVADRQLGRNEEAVTEFRAAMKANPKDADTAYRLGALLMGLGRPAEAEPYLRIAAQQEPDFIKSQLGLATAALQHNDAIVALAKCRIVFALEPEHPGALYLAGQAFLQLGRLEAAQATFQEILRHHPAHAAAHTEIGRLLLHHGESTAAAEHFRAALATDPSSAGALYELSVAEAQTGQEAEAGAHLARAAEFAPDDPVIALAWGRTLARQHRFGEAVGPLERVVQKWPRNANAHAELGYNLWLAGERERAIAEWEQALALDPNLTDLRERLARLRP